MKPEAEIKMKYSKKIDKAKKGKNEFVKAIYICPSCGTKSIRKIPKLNVLYYTKGVKEKNLSVSMITCRKCHIKGVNLYDYSLLDSSFFTSYLSPIKIDKCQVCDKKTKELFVMAEDTKHRDSRGAIACRECREIGIERGMIDKNIKVFS